MQVMAPMPPGDGAVMWWASAVEAEPSTSARIVAPRCSAALPLLEHEHGAALGHHEAVAPTSNGREIPDDEMAVMLVKPATPVGVMAASALPAITASQRPVWISRAPLPIEWVPAAHAVVVVSHGPCQP